MSIFSDDLFTQASPSLPDGCITPCQAPRHYDKKLNIFFPNKIKEGVSNDQPQISDRIYPLPNLAFSMRQFT
jgi:hypothetical protein